MIGSLSGGGVNKILVNDALGKITQAAVETLVSAGLTGEIALQSAVQTITKGAVTAISSITVEGVEAADYASLATEIAKGAATGVGKIADSPTQVALFAGSVAAGAANGVVAIISNTAMTDIQMKALVLGVTSGATAGAMLADGIDPATNGAALISQITTNASSELTKSTEIGMTEGAILAEVTHGAAAAATIAAKDGGFANTAANTALLEGIQLTGSNGASVTVDQVAVAAGVQLGTNNVPVANAGNDQAVVAGSVVSLDGTASSDADSDDVDSLVYAWSISAKPATAEVSITDPSNPTATFTPPVSGTYLISLKVSDSKGTSSESFCTITVLPSAENVLYGGKTALERFDIAKTLMDNGDTVKARDEFLLVVTRYPVSSVNANALFQLAKCYQQLNQIDLAFARLQEVLKDFATSEVAPAARNSLGWIYFDNYKDKTKAAEQFQAVKDQNLATRDGAESLRGLGRIAMKNGNLADATILCLDARDHLNADVWVRHDSQMDIAEIFQLQGQIEQALAAVYVVLDDVDGKYTRKDPADPATEIQSLRWKTELDLSDGYNGLSKSNPSYQTDRLALLKTMQDNTKYAPWMRLIPARLLGEYWLWETAQNYDNTIKARDILTAAMAAYTGTDIRTLRERDFVKLRLGQANQQLADQAKTNAERDAFITAAFSAFDSTAVNKNVWWGIKIAAECQIEKATILMWQKRDYKAAESILLNLISMYPKDIDQYPAAYALSRLGQVYREMGMDARDKYGKDPVLYFQRAISYFNKSKPEFFPGLDPNDWYFQEAAQNMGDTYSDLGELTTARAIFNSMLAKADYDSNRKAWVQYFLAKTYRNEARQLVNDGKFDQVASVFTTAESEFLKVRDYKNTDGTPVNNGWQAADAQIEMGGMYREAGEQMENYGYDAAVTIATFQKAADVYAFMTDSLFKNLDQGAWWFGEALKCGARSVMGTRAWNASRGLYQDLLDKINAGVFSESMKPNIFRDIAYTWRREAELTNTKDDSGNPLTANCALVLDRISNAVAKYKEAIALGKDLDDGQAAAESIADIGWSYNRLFDGNLYTSDPTLTLAGYVSDMKNLMSATNAFKRSDGTMVDEGRPQAGAYSALGNMQQSYAYFVRGWKTDWKTLFAANMQDALNSYDAASKIVGAYPDDIMDSRVNMASCYFELASVSDANSAANFEFGRDEAESVIVDPEAKAQFVARAATRLGWAYLNSGPFLIGEVSDIGTEADWKTGATFWFNFVLDNTQYRNTDGFWSARDCQSGLDSDMLKSTLTNSPFEYISSLPSDGMYHMISSKKLVTHAYFEIMAAEAGEYTFSWTDGTLPGETNVKVTMTSADKSALFTEVDSGPQVVYLAEGRYTVSIQTADTKGVSCRLILSKN